MPAASTARPPRWPARLLHALWPRRLRRQLGLAVVLVLGLTLLPLGLLAVREQTELLRQGVASQAATLARNLALASEGAIVTGDLAVLEALLLRSLEDPMIEEILVIDAGGRRLGHVLRPAGRAGHAVFDAPALRPQPPATLQPQVQLDPTQARVVAWHPVDAGSPLGWVRVDLATGPLQALRERLLMGTLLAGLLAGLGSLAALAWLMQRPLRAIEQACEFAAALEQMDGRHIEPARGPDETQALAQSLNAASTRLHELRCTVDASFERLRLQEAEQADRNEQLRTIFALSPDGLLSFDAQGRVKFSNAAFHRLTGLHWQIVRHCSVDALDSLLRAQCAPPAPALGIASLWSSSSDEAAATTDPTRLTLTLVSPRRTVLELLGLRGRTESVSRLLYLRDITHESEVARLKSEFLNTAAHELRTPMTSIHACVELMLTREFDAGRRQHLLGIMQRQSQTLVTLVNELLDLARIEARQSADLDWVTVDLPALVQQTVAEFPTPRGREPPRLHQPAAEAPAWPTLRLDRRRTAQVLHNLLSNAYKYSQQGEVAVRLLGPGDGDAASELGFEVTDQGIGMSPAEVAQVGERFFRADASGHVPGTGLGMSIVKELVALMHGRLQIDSTPGQGTSVRIGWRLPPVPMDTPDLGTHRIQNAEHASC